MAIVVLVIRLGLRMVKVIGMVRVRVLVVVIVLLRVGVIAIAIVLLTTINANKKILLLIEQKIHFKIHTVRICQDWVGDSFKVMKPQHGSVQRHK